MALPNFATNLAVIKKSNNNTVTNIAWGYVYDKSWLADDEDIVAVGNLAVTMGDTYNYTDEHFYHADGTIVKSTEEENTENTAGLMDEITSLCEEIIGE